MAYGAPACSPLTQHERHYSPEVSRTSTRRTHSPWVERFLRPERDVLPVVKLLQSEHAAKCIPVDPEISQKPADVQRTKYTDRPPIYLELVHSNQFELTTSTESRQHPHDKVQTWLKQSDIEPSVKSPDVCAVLNRRPLAFWDGGEVSLSVPLTLLFVCCRIAN
jgi:hypothetical protein